LSEIDKLADTSQPGSMIEMPMRDEDPVDASGRLPLELELKIRTSVDKNRLTTDQQQGKHGCGAAPVRDERFHRYGSSNGMRGPGCRRSNQGTRGSILVEGDDALPTSVHLLSARNLVFWPTTHGCGYSEVMQSDLRPRII
jgi:hypothetical protein